MFDEVLAYCDSSRGADAAVTAAVELARETDARLHLLYLVQQRGTDRYRATHSEEKVSEDSDARDEIDALVRRAGVESETHVEIGEPKTHIRLFAEKYDADAVVVGVIDKNFSHIIRNSVAEEVVHSAPMPVLAVQLDEQDVRDVDVYRCRNCESGFQSTVDDSDYVQCPYCGAESVVDESLG